MAEILTRSEQGSRPRGSRLRGGRARGGRQHLLLWGLVVVIAVGLIFAVILDVVLDPEPLDPASPEGVVQAYLQDVLDGDTTGARSYLSEDAAERCSAQELRRSWIPDGLTATLSEVRRSEEVVEVEVRMRTIEGPAPFGGGSYTTTEVFTLTEENGQWRISEDPWPIYDCGGRR
jgi:hypothetical protein